MSTRDARGRSLQTAVRAGVLSATVTVSLLTYTPAFAVVPDDGDHPGAALGALDTLLIFVGIPALMVVIIAGLVILADDKSKSKRGPKR